ncbi:hypothetical protein RJ639_039719 [Escallonia herrerae]|uniref:Uncharacterized protein n=1 Tax=Escallonia herrerae TaxID=1293975 RepID=A0AA88WMP2_9ASTE|nr:hypothetical protein RJ639_039719 [Escallonia herrerae]
MATSSQTTRTNHTRSISLPSRFHPSTARTEQELNKLKTWETSTTQTAEKICDSLSGMEEICKCIDGVLNLPLTQQALSQRHHEAWADELLDRSLRLLDAFSSTWNDEHVRDIHSSLRRRKGESSTRSSIVRFTSFRKKMKKNTKRLIAALKQMDNQIEVTKILDLDGHPMAVIKLLREVTAMSITIFQSLMLFLCLPAVKKNPSRWSMVSKLIAKGTVCENHLDSMNELERLDAALRSIYKCTSSDEDKMQIAQSRLEALEGCIEGFENGLECSFRQLIKTRASLLNVFSHQEHQWPLLRKPAIDRHHTRSISLPSRSHPSTLRIEEELNKLKTREVSSDLTAETICTGLSEMEELYKCIDDLLSLPLTQQALSVHPQKVSANEFLDGSLRLFDICGITKATMSQIKGHVRDLQSSLRRKKGELSIKSSIIKFTSFRKKIKKDAKRLIADMKQMDWEMGSSQVLDLDHHLGAVIRVLREVSAVSISIFQSLLVFLSVPVLKKSPSRWSVVSKLMSKWAACENEPDSMNELERADAALRSLCKRGSIDEEKMKTAQSRLEVLEVCIEVIENGLESVFRRSIKTRAAFLNIFSN